MSTELHPQYITDESGKRVSVVLPIEEFQALAEHIEDMEDLADAREALDRIHQGTEQSIPWGDIKAEHGL